ncbi:hypothetical protein GH714_031652 [Hevea brasiliensis]|uniref:Protein root UVB sensitive/RUS domain-containing protein n=1 Tax=Hevea brasiliensis TaxID=3981 RepID=A0A6A6L3W2_HEVBR|nr:hypothetical protein GH714_031652 [Hevea brasiliensis]
MAGRLVFLLQLKRLLFNERYTDSSQSPSPRHSQRTSINYEREEGLDEGPGPILPVRLPVVIRHSGKVSRYIWDGSSLKLASVHSGALSLCLDFEDGFRKLFRVSSLAVRNFFIPKQVPDKCIGQLLAFEFELSQAQVEFGDCIGYSRSLPSAAALNWVLKDGLGRLSRCIYTASLASAFDINLKRVRFSTSVLFSLSIGVELLTPAFPQQFFLLATIANIAKQISLACYLATGSAIHRSFSLADNLPDKWHGLQIQTVCFDNLGLMIAALLNMLLKNNQRLLAGLPFVVYPIFLAIDLFGIYQGLKHVHLQTLTKDRLEIILNSWIELGRVPSPAEACYVGKALLFSRWETISEANEPEGSVLKEWTKLIEDSKRAAERSADNAHIHAILSSKASDLVTEIINLI